MRAMKTNQIFNFNRFGRYAQSAMIMHYRQLLLLIGAVSASLFLYVLIITNTAMEGNWELNDWRAMFFTTFSIGGIMYVGYAFSPLRKKEKTIKFLLIPASTLEKFIYELIEKFLLFWLLFPTLFYVFGNLAIKISTVLRRSMGQYADMKPFSTVVFTEGSPDGQMRLIIILGIMLFILAFAGAATFRKYPLIKTIVFCGGVVAIVAGYFYMIMEKLHLHHPWIENLGDHLSKQQGLALINSVMLIFSLIVLAFAYFKLKEREVQ
jgi:hypothetical protein